MRPMESTGPWAVYRMPVRQAKGRMAVVCLQQEWDVIESAKPGDFTLVRGGIATEGEAEQFARNLPHAPPAPPEPKKPTVASVFGQVVA
jgi:hypothetical protein